MSGLVGLLAGGAVSNLASPVVNRLVDLIPDNEKRAEEAAGALQALIAADEAIATQQNAINLQEAKSESLFVSGWRPFIGWSCGVALLWQVLLAPFVRFNLAILGFHPEIPPLDATWISAILIPMLGIGAMRTVEKVQGVAGDPASRIPRLSTRSRPTPPAAPPLPAGPSGGALEALRRTAQAASGRAATPAGTAVPASADPGTIDLLARTLWGEARGEGGRGMEAVAAVICRRAQHPRWWGRDISSVCLAPGQFACWRPGDPNRAQLEAVDLADAGFAAAVAIAGRAVAGLLEDPTNRADSYANLARARPPWIDLARQTAVIGQHTFFRLET